MAGKVFNLSPWGGPTRIKGIAHTYYSIKFQRWITRSWPKGQGPDSAMRQLGRETFKNVVQAIKSVDPMDREGALETSRNTPYLERDLLYKAATGTLFQFSDTTGRQWMSTRVAIQTIQPMLDSIAHLPGSVLFRGPNYWDALSPPADERVMMFDAVTGLPAWITLEDAATTILDSLSMNEGDILVRGPTAWEVITPGTPGYALISQGAGNIPAWGAVTPPSSLVTYGCQIVPDVSGNNVDLARASAGNTIFFGDDCTLHGLTAQMTTVTGATYKMGIAQFNFSTLKITGAPTYTGPKTIGTGRANDPHTYIFGSEFAATAGQQYVIFIVRTDGTPTTTLRINQSAVTQVAPSIRLVQGVAVSLASQAPTTSDTWTNTTTTVYGVGAIYRIT